VKPLAIVATVACVAAAAVAGYTTIGSAEASCAFPQGVQTVAFSRAKYPNIYQHWVDAVAKGWPKILLIERVGNQGRRTKLLANVPTRDGMDRDEYPPDVGREGWLGDVEYVPSSENRKQGASLGGQLRKWCNGTRFEYDWQP
jgi:hypothetical protein